MPTQDEIRNAARRFEAELHASADALAAVLTDAEIHADSLAILRAAGVDPAPVSPLCDCNGDGCEACGFTGVTQAAYRQREHSDECGACESGIQHTNLEHDQAVAAFRRHAPRMCAGGCQLRAEPGDVFCQGCREGHEYNRPIGRDW